MIQREIFIFLLPLYRIIDSKKKFSQDFTGDFISFLTLIGLR